MFWQGPGYDSKGKAEARESKKKKRSTGGEKPMGAMISRHSLKWGGSSTSKR
jgi:hypothetical protein